MWDRSMETSTESGVSLSLDLCSGASYRQMAGIAVAGSVLFQANAGKSRPSVSIPVQLHKEFMPALPAFISLNQRRHEVLPSKSLQTSLIRCFDTNKGASAKSEANAKPNNRYFDRDTIADAAARIAPAVANVYSQQGRVLAGEIGSGTVIHEDGYILTCAHVVFNTKNAIYSADGEVSVCLQDVEKSIVGRVVDAYVDLDIAVIKIDSPSSPLPTAKVGSSSKLRPGDWAIAMGSPLSLQHTVTLGIISCVHRTKNESGLPGMPMEYLQTDCAINPGNSGGPLCNVDGEVVGVNLGTVNVEKASGVSFAVPVDFISAIIKPFQNCRRPVRPDFGWVMQNVSEENFKALKKYYPQFPNAREGVFVQKVIKGSPADRAGIQTGDVVVELNGKPVRNIKEMMDAMGERSGAPVQVLVERARDGMDASVPLTITFQEKGVARS
ncbi:putative protease Do-like 14 isoform X3 [Rhodamnia argentea]|uniref:Protease Do-like 14 isoform X3 n=1 Tax=Rhodamnia argentea TaxID=178133 RepID=A0ABM3H7E1_9MYRT|nr:putative protease Do-like 14 isoform X3 [Rhodamnia argentea]